MKMESSPSSKGLVADLASVFLDLQVDIVDVNFEIVFSGENFSAIWARFI